jgi:phenylalanine-4-hydroxylase
VREKGALKIFGAGILSSIGETKHCVSGKAKLAPFDVEAIIATPYLKDDYQAQYFVLNNLADLQTSVNTLEQIFKPIAI